MKNKKENLFKLFKQFPKTFWIANSMEILERWAWYGLFTVLAVYLTDSTDVGGLGFSQTDKGTILGVVTAILYLMPVVTGAIADAVGYKKVLFVAYTILSSGYFLMGQFTGFWSVFFVFLYIAMGAALFKPVISATVSKTTTDKNSSIGFGIFYMMINIGGFLGPIAASKLRNNPEYGWTAVFIMASVTISLNFILLIFYKEPERKKRTEPLFAVVKKSISNIATALSDIKFLIFLVLIVGFWTMFNQIFYTLPNFIEQWVDTRPLYDLIYSFSPMLADLAGTPQKTISQEMMINLDAGAIIFFQLIVSGITMKFKPLNSMMIGILICGAGVGLSFITMNPFFVLLGIFIFALGEMASSPKFTEYIGKIAPKDKIALYMGCSFLPVAAGNLFAGYLSGAVYESLADKITLLKAEVLSKSLSITEIGTKVNGKIFTQNDYINKACEILNLNKEDLTNMLWQKYNPSKIWMIFTIIGVVTVAGLFLYDRFIIGEKNN